MEKRGTAILPLHYGHPPEYLYRRMVKLGGIICDLISEKFGTETLLEKMSDPFWFHSLSLAIGFDWNSSGTTTATLSALKEYYSPGKGDISIIGGKGSKMGNVRDELKNAELNGFIDDSQLPRIYSTSKKVARIDQNLLQDSYNLYLQFIILDARNRWSIIQQGLNSESRLARRYHWSWEIKNDFLNDGRSGLSGFYNNNNTLDLSSSLSENNRKGMLEVARENPQKFYFTFAKKGQITIDSFSESGTNRHKILNMDYRIDWNKMRELYEYQPSDFQSIMDFKGVGKSTLRALSYLAEVIYGESPSYEDPVKYSFALGGKDGVPKPVNTHDYDLAIEFYNEVLSGTPEKKAVMDKLSRSLSKYSAFKTGAT
ncbi:DUF763 domain-containing protein [Oxyplasma meridianum]|uniref:DUF763 domain-containing protein n=1 Tax=Oxyplasma meridianum TaxID=3073602 RepID=A0AAX4NG59_9ARCH